MRNAAVFCFAGVCVLVALPMAAQSVPRTNVAAAKVGDGAGLLWSQRTMRFTNGKPVLGLPSKNGKSMTRCGSDNTAYFNLDGGSQLSDAAGVPRLYSISTGGEVKSLLRKLPVDFNDISVRDFFVGEHTIVTLLHATRRDDQGVSETKYFLSLMDPQGDFRDLVQVEGHFKPLKVAAFGGGDVMVLGWDEANLLPMLAVLKEDGTIRHFIDLDDRKAKGAFDRGSVTAEMLEDAAFVALGGDVLLTFPGTTKAMLELNSGGVVGSIPIQLPSGYVLHDVLYSGSRGPLVVRAQATKDMGKPALYDEAQDTQRRMFEMTYSSGKLLDELVFDKPTMSEVACAGGSSLTAIFNGTVVDADHATAGTAQLLVSSVRR